MLRVRRITDETALAPMSLLASNVEDIVAVVDDSNSETIWRTVDADAAATAAKLILLLLLPLLASCCKWTT